jgi:cytochrome b subunit of formate dehydrogenase
MNETEPTYRGRRDVPGEKRELAVSLWGKFVYLLLLLAVAFLALTGIGTFVGGYSPMTHWVLMSHVAVAPVFAIALVLVALTWSDRCRFGCDRTVEKPLARFLMWMILLCGLVVILSGVTPMLPLFGTEGQHFLYLTHRYGGITLATLILLHLWARR